MTKAKNIKYTSALLIILLLCGLSVAGPTYSFVQMTAQSKSTGLSQPGYTPWNLAKSMGKAVSLYSNMASQSSPRGEVFDGLGEVSALCIRPATPSNSALSGHGKNASSYKNPEFFNHNGDKWGYWTQSKGKGRRSFASKSYGYGFPDDLMHPDFPDSFGDGSPVKPGDLVADPAANTAVPTPAAISLSCLGLILVGWLRNRKAF